MNRLFLLLVFCLFTISLFPQNSADEFADSDSTQMSDVEDEQYDQDLNLTDSDNFETGNVDYENATDAEYHEETADIDQSDEQLTEPEEVSIKKKKIQDKGTTKVQEVIIEKKVMKTVKQKVKGPSEVTGIILEKGTRTPLRRVKFYIKETRESVRTDKKGRFSFKIDAGKYTIIIPVVGYERFKTEIEVRESEKLDLTFRLEPEVINPYKIVVKAKRISGEVSAQRVTIEEATSVPGTNRDVLKVITNMPGVTSISVFNGFGSGLVVRGSAPEDSLRQVNDQWIPILYHFGGFESVIEPELVESIDFYAGGFSPEYFNAMGGVIQLNLRDPRDDRWGGYANMSLLSASMMVEGPVTEKDSVAVALKRGFLDFYIQILNEAGALQGVSFTTYPYYYDGVIAWKHEFSKRNYFRLYLIGALDEVRLHIDNESETQKIGDEAENVTQFSELIGEWYYKKGKITSVLSPMVQQIYFNFNFGNSAFLKNTLIQSSISEKLDYKLNKNHKLRFGARVIHGYYTLDINLFAPPKEGEVTYNPFDEDNEMLDNSAGHFWYPGIYIIDMMTYGNWIIQPGALFIFDTHNTKFIADPRLSVKYNIDKKWTLKAASGLYSQIPANDENYEPWGTPNLDPERSIHLIGGVEHRLTDNIEFDIQGYYKWFFDMVVRDDNDTPFSYDNLGKGYAYGAEIMIRHKMTDNFFGWLTYSWGVSRRKDALGTGDNPPEWRPFDLDINHNFIAVASYKINKYWQVGARFNLISGAPYTDLLNEDTIYDVDNDIYMPQYEGAVNPNRLPIRHQLDIRIDKYWLFDNWILSSYLDVQNVYLRDNIFAYRYSKDYTRKIPVEGIPIMVFLGFKGDF